MAEAVRGGLEKLRRAGPFHNLVATQAEVDRLAALLGPVPAAEPAPAPVPAAVTEPKPVAEPAASDPPR